MVSSMIKCCHQVNFAALIPFVGWLVPDVTKGMQIPNAFMITGAGRNLGNLHKLVAKRLHGSFKVVLFPIMQQSHVQAHMHCIDPWIIGYSGKEVRKRVGVQHSESVLTNGLSFLPTAFLFRFGKVSGVVIYLFHTFPLVFLLY